MTGKATPGPWKVLSSKDGEPIEVIGADRTGVIRMRSICRPTTENGKSNANLIAAAPELLEACERLLENYQVARHINGHTRDTEDIRFARVAIANAKGGQK